MSTNAQPIDFGKAELSWNPLQALPIEARSRARVQVHWASQVLGSFGHVLATKREDWSHTALSWEDEALVSAAAEEALRARLVPDSLRLELLRADGTRIAARDFAGESLEGMRRWAAEAVGSETGTEVRELEAGPWELPAHPLGDGAAFDPPAAPALRSIARGFANAWVLLEPLAEFPGSLPRRIWPHHFDLAVLHLLDGVDADPETSPSINIGFSPGDEQSPEAYYYLRPWPEPKVEVSAALPAGEWHREGWFGAVLGEPELIAAGDGSAQAELAGAFVEAAFVASRGYLRP